MEILIQDTNAKDLKGFNICDEQQLDSSKKIVAKKFIAKGSFASVYRGFYGDRKVAIKVLDWGEDDESFNTSMLRESCQEEVLVWCYLDHPNISKFIGATLGTCREIGSGKMDKPKNVCCVVSEYQPRGTLRSYLSKHREKKLNLNTVVRISLELAKGLSYLHSEKVVHRDIKPENILLDKNKTVKICDFGVARPEAPNRNEMNETDEYVKMLINPYSGVSKRNILNRHKMTELIGTVGYMAPEVFCGDKYTRKCDVYSFGICLWEIYCCDMAYKRLTPDDNSYPDIYERLRPEIPSSCPKSLRNVMESCWNLNPSKRPEMEDVVSTLEAVDTSKRKRRFLPCICA